MITVAIIEDERALELIEPTDGNPKIRALI